MAIVMALQNLRADGDITTVGGVDKMNTTDSETVQLLEQILTTLKKMEYHLSIATDTNLNDQDV